MSNPNLSNPDQLNDASSNSIEIAPVLYTGPFDPNAIKALADGKTTVAGATNIREGVVIRTLAERHAHGLGRVLLKLVSNAFLEKSA